MAPGKTRKAYIQKISAKKKRRQAGLQDRS